MLLRGSTSSATLPPDTRVTVTRGPLNGHTGTVIRDQMLERPDWVRCDLVWVLLDAGDNPQRFRRDELELECERCEGYGVVSGMAPCTTFGPDCGCNEWVEVQCPDCRSELEAA